MGNFNCAGTGDRTGNSRDPSFEKITCDRMESDHGPIRSARTMPKGLATVAVSSLVFPDLYPFFTSLSELRHPVYEHLTWLQCLNP